jgi:hypothetical protein
MSKQEQKYDLSLPGEFFVAAELQRRGISAAVTYGNLNMPTRRRVSNVLKTNGKERSARRSVLSRETTQHSRETRSRQSHHYQTDEKTVALLLPSLKIDISPS